MFSNLLDILYFCNRLHFLYVYLCHTTVSVLSFKNSWRKRPQLWLWHQSDKKNNRENLSLPLIYSKKEEKSYGSYLSISVVISQYSQEGYHQQQKWFFSLEKILSKLWQKSDRAKSCYAMKSLQSPLNSSNTQWAQNLLKKL